ncbi:MAG: hypothetical protein ACK4TA_09925 [Saprospiraceae bacterium]
MKDFKKMLILSALVLSIVLFVSAVASAANPIVTITPAGYAKKVSVVLDQLAAPATIWVVNAEGTLLLEEKTEGAKFAKVFNLENLPEGSYKVIVTTDRKEIVQPITLNTSALVVNDAAREEYFAPFIRVREDAIDVMWLNNRLGDVSVAILDEQGGIVYEEAMENVLKVEKRYKTSDLGKGNYTVRVSTPRKDYYQAIAVK